MKKTIRKEILIKRNKLTEKKIASKSLAIMNNLIPLTILKNSNHIMLYISFGSELDTKPLIDHLFNQNKKVYIPLTIPATREMIVSELLDFKNDLEMGNFGVLEPKQESLRPMAADNLDLVIVPGVAFDKEGYRIGYGGGYYDRFLPQLPPSTTKISLAYDIQIINNIPKMPHDYPVQYIITENQVINCKDHGK